MITDTLQLYLPARMRADDFYVIVAGLLAIVCVVTLGMTYGKGSGSSMARIKAIQERRKELQADALAPKKRLKPEANYTFIRMVVMKMQLLKSSQIGKIEAQLLEAGFRSKDAIYIVTFFNMLMPILLGVAGFIFMRLNTHISPKWHTLNYAWPIVGIYIGMKLPGIYVGYVRRKRYLQIQRSLSDVLDLMTICAEAGLSLAAMLDRVSRELVIAYPEMAEELSLTAIEIGFLPDRNKALTNLAERCKLPEVRGIVSVLIQTEKYGTPITQALRVLSAEFRQTRMLRAEHKAAKLPAMMTVPMIVFILPTLFIVIIAPAAIGILNNMAAAHH